MVVCKCRKATKLYCFVHKVPVCGECICFPEHQICVVSTYAQWVIDGEYDWPSKCCMCHGVLQDGADSRTTRLGCLHPIHTSCLVSHIKGFPPHTAPASYVCPTCSAPIWPPKSIKDSGSSLHTKLKEAIMQTGLEKNLFGNHAVSLPTTESRAPPPAFASDPLHRASSIEDTDNSYAVSKLKPSVAKEDNYSTESHSPATGIASSNFLSVTPEINGNVPSFLGNQFQSDHEANFINISSPAGPGATTRKSAFNVERQNAEYPYYADDVDATQKKYSRRGSFRHKFIRSLLPFWSSALPTLPVTAPPRKDTSNVDDIPEARSRHHKPSKMDLRKILLLMSIMACLATMGILYYRLAQSSLGENLPGDDPQ